MLNWNEYLLELEFKKWESLSEATNEGFSSLMDRIDAFLDKEYEINTDKFEEIALNLLKRFKGKIKILTIIATLLLGSYFGLSKLSQLIDKAGITSTQKEQIINSAQHKNINKKSVSRITKAKDEIGKFLKHLAKRESSSRPKITNDLGYIGKYQMGQMALKDLELDDKINAEKFRKNPAIFPEKMQDKAMVKLLKLNKQYLGDYINDFDGKNIGGVKITKSGLLAGSHLVGAGAVKRFLDSNGQFVPKDGNGVPVTDYIEEFAGYNLTF